MTQLPARAGEATKDPREPTGKRDAVHRTICRYMELCDVPSVDFSLTELASLFSYDAVWEGVGPEYASKFGTQRGRPAIAGMLAQFLPPNPHFIRNVHLLTNELIDVAEAHARGRWLLQQLSAYADGRSELMVARVSADCVFDRGIARIKHFRTEKLFVTPLDSAAIHLSPDSAAGRT
ncbi:nuclear transport factor 2 family protein [Nocardia sp. NPDC050793]|uniref:nuclear transport factor 2 family protein n=1 Tax=Nocardia sp. NPDC050793 TaxID=3155159 RepID=UPI0033EB6AA5